MQALVADARSSSAHDFGKNIIPNILKSKKVHGFVFENSRFGHYWRDVGTISSYYQSNMDYLTQLEEESFSIQEWPIRSAGEQLPPSYFGDGSNITINRSAIGIGAYINSGSHIERSLIGRNVKIGKNTTIKNSIIMNDCVIGNDCIIEKSIFDYNIKIPDNTSFGIKYEEDIKRFTVSNGITVLPKNYEYE